MEPILFSVLIPAYKGAFLKDAITSVLNQTYPNFEIIIVNDASPEDLTSIVKTFDDPRIHYYINDKNSGAQHLVDNWNRCLDHAKGEYCICMGDDDMLLPNCLQAYADLIKQYPGLNVYHGWSQIIDENNQVTDVQEPRQAYENIYSLVYHNFFKGRRQFIGDYLFKTEALKQMGGFYWVEYGWCSDDLTVFNMAKGTGVANTQEYVFQYRQTSRTVSSNIPVLPMWQARHQKIEWVREFMRDEAPGMSDLDKFFRAKTLQDMATWEKHNCMADIRIDIIDHGFGRGFRWLKSVKGSPLGGKLKAVAVVQGWFLRLQKKMYKTWNAF